MLDESIQKISSSPGSYLLWLHLSQPKYLSIGKLGSFTFPIGDYIYLGSARGSGGLHARLGRHLRGDGKTHWHIDYLRAASQVRGFGYQTNAMHFQSAPHLLPKECTWSQKLTALPNASIPVPHFGASDCQSGCAAHLIHYPALNSDQITTLLNGEIQILGVE